MSASTVAVYLCFVLCLQIGLHHARILTTGKSTIMENNTVNITINTNLNVVDIELTALIPSPLVWNAFGFGSNVMLGTYTIVVDYTFPDEVPLVIESTLATRGIGTIYTEPEISIMSDTNDGITRIVHIRRSINGTYSFPVASITLDMISAIGQKSNFQRCSGQRQPGCQHVAGSGRSTKTLVLEEIISPTTIVTIPSSVAPTVYPTAQPSATPTVEPTTNPTLSPIKPPSNIPTVNPSASPAAKPTSTPTVEPTTYPTNAPTQTPVIITIEPTLSPVAEPTLLPTFSPIITSNPTKPPSKSPTIHPVASPTVFPTIRPTSSPIKSPTTSPTKNPTPSPSIYPTTKPTSQPTFAPVSLDPNTWICDEDAKCKHHLISCHETNETYCNLHCLSSASCQYTIFECPSDRHCDVSCEGYKACDSLSIIGRQRGYLNVECHGNSSCISANINAVHSKTLNIACIGDQSCNDIALWCPPYTLSESVSRANCKIAAAATDNDLSTVNKMRIYADNSWNDIDETSHLPIGTEVEMFCHSDTSQCVLHQWNESWNCPDTQSLCYVSEHIETTSLPSYTSSVQALTTENAVEEEELSYTLIVCDDHNPCDENIVCNDTKCHVLCNADNSCKSSNICNMKENSILTVECNGYASCEGANLFGKDLLYMIVTCSGFEACKSANFYGNNSKLLNIECLDSGGSCQDMNVFCPLDRRGCVISNDGNEGNDVHRNLDFYAVHGFDDLDISDYTAILLNDSSNITNRMHCGADYQSFCRLDASLFCECNHTKEDFYWLHRITVAEIVAISISGSVLVSIIGLLTVCVFCPKTNALAKDEEKTEVEMENKELMEKDSSNYNAIVMQCDDESDHDSDHEIQYEDGNESKKKKHPKHSLYRKV